MRRTSIGTWAYNIGPYSSNGEAGRRYVSKIDRYRDTLANYPL